MRHKVLFVLCVAVLALALAYSHGATDERDDGEASPDVSAGSSGGPDSNDQDNNAPDSSAQGSNAQSWAEVSLSPAQVFLSPAMWEQGGLRTQALRAVDFSPELKAFGRVVDIGPMVDLRDRYDKARLSGSRSLMRNIRTQSDLLWGRTLSAQLFDEGGLFLESVAAGQEVLVQVTLPLTESLAAPAPARLYRNSEEGHPIAAAYISPSPRIDPAVQGETHFYRASAERLRIGMAVDVAILPEETLVQGVFIPRPAVVRHEGQAWVYRLEQNTPRGRTFRRFAIPLDYKMVDGWLAPRPDWAGSQLLVTGVQMVLSEEFRLNLPDDDDDDDDD